LVCARRQVQLCTLLKHLWAKEAAGADPVTLLGIGPMSPRVIRAALELAQDKRFPVMFIASRNQVDSSRFGGGYIRGWDQKEFASNVEEIAQQVGFTGLYYLCRDHGGPWQRDEEYGSKLPYDEAMHRARESYLDDLLAGFDIIHIDPTKDPHQRSLSLSEVADRAVALIEFLEKEKTVRGIEKQISYEVGTEETKGGLISGGDFDWFLREITEKLTTRHLPGPDFIVGQTGTLVKLGRNVGRFSAENASELAMIARRYGVGFKEHNADYLDESQLRDHPRAGITAANVAPEFGHIETRAYIELADLEKEAFKRGRLSLKPSRFQSVLETAVIESGRWEKWLTDEFNSIADLRRCRERFDATIAACGHYVFDDPRVVESVAALFTNISKLGLVKDPERWVLGKIKQGIDRYVASFNCSNSLPAGDTTQN